MKPNSYVGHQMKKYYNSLAKKTDTYYYAKAFTTAQNDPPTLVQLQAQEEQFLLQSIQDAHGFTSGEARNAHMNIEQFLEKTSPSLVKQRPLDMLKNMKSMAKTQTEIVCDAQKEAENEQQKELELQQLEHIAEVKKTSVAFGAQLSEKERKGLVQQTQFLNVQDERLQHQSLSEYIDGQYIVASFIDLKASSLYLHYQEVMFTVDFVNKFIISQEFYEFVQVNTTKCEYKHAIDVLVKNWSQNLMKNLVTLIEVKVQEMRLPVIQKRPRSYLQMLIGSNSAFVQFAVSYIVAKLSQYTIMPDPYSRFPILQPPGKHENLLVSIF
ncbi:hypothetical protein SS50377_23057 [Spironucleus salmonicida]|uniref:Uncharacterized protein n=1 Tax=Spironucleus salmonicida TaxID=348837 RepID=V6M2Z3_9EUKA|nr:hypothetical protein SS50377_23057 [Spironucleus salmonicida]|eukprot:EST47634.1 Hypothetical protein SS50377_12328 [Spironucleus salmonicida]